MPHISEMKQSKFLTKADVGKGALMTIIDCKQEAVNLPGTPEELKWALHFQETEKPWVLNSTCAQIISSILGSQQTEDWIGQQVVLYTDPNISFQGRLVGGIRVRAPRNVPPTPDPRTAATRPAPAARAPEPLPPSLQSEPPDDPDDVPF